LKEVKFKSQDLKLVYTTIKAVKTILGVILDNYKLKKLLWKTNEFQCFVPSQLLYEVMCLPEIRAPFESKID
jgi:hypothetical protein